jgi:1,4-dihydroxy-2-naphthoate octaprenyltransferase
VTLFFALVAGLPYALHVANLLFINQFPDVKADAAAGKRNLVVRLGPQRARWLYALIAIAAYAWLAARGLVRNALRPAALDPAIRATIGAALVHGALLAAALALA